MRASPTKMCLTSALQAPVLPPKPGGMRVGEAVPLLDLCLKVTQDQNFPGRHKHTQPGKKFFSPYVASSLVLEEGQLPETRSLKFTEGATDMTSTSDCWTQSVLWFAQTSSSSQICTGIQNLGGKLSRLGVSIAIPHYQEGLMIVTR